MIAYGEGALWALTGESDTIERIDPKTNAVVESVPLGRIGEAGTGWRYRMAAGQGAIWVLAPASLWRIDSTTKRFVGSVPLGRSEEGSSVATGDRAVWVAKPDGILLRIDPDSQTVAKTIPLGRLIRPTSGTPSRLARNRSGLRSRQSLHDDIPPMLLELLTPGLPVRGSSQRAAEHRSSPRACRQVSLEAGEQCGDVGVIERRELECLATGFARRGRLVQAGH